jgi:hypothetical protein
LILFLLLAHKLDSLTSMDTLPAHLWRDIFDLTPWANKSAGPRFVAWACGNHDTARVVASRHSIGVSGVKATVKNGVRKTHTLVLNKQCLSLHRLLAPSDVVRFKTIGYIVMLWTARNNHACALNFLREWQTPESYKYGMVWEALRLASKHAHMDVLLFMKSQWDIKQHAVDLSHGVSAAAKRGHLEVLTFLKTTWIVNPWHMYSSDIKKALVGASRNNHVDVLRFFRDWNTWTFNLRRHCKRMTCEAAKNGHVGVLDFIKGWGETCYTSFGLDDMPATEMAKLAARHGHGAVLQWLRQCGMQWSDLHNRTTLYRAVEGGHVEIMRCLKSWADEVGWSILDSIDDSTLRIAAVQGDVDVLRVLKEWGVTPV